MRSIIPTMNHGRLQTALYARQTPPIPAHTTLNEKFGIRASDVLNVGEFPALGIWTIGKGGHRTQLIDDFAYTTPKDHEAFHNALYDHLPFVLRPLNEDLTLDQRRKYALRKEITAPNGSNYYAYYGKRLDLTQVTIEDKRTTVTDGVESSVVYTPDASTLSPTPPDIDSTGEVTTSGQSLSTTCILPIEFSASDVEELYNVARVLFNNEVYALISEIGLCTGVDRTVPITTSGGNANFSEFVVCQISAFAPVHYELMYHSEGFRFTVDVGAVQPLLGADAITTATILTF